MNRIFGVIALVAIIALSSCSKQSILEKMAEEANKQCPMIVDEITTCDSIVAQKGNKMAYFYTISADVPNLDKDMFSKNIKQAMKMKVQTDPMMKALVTTDVIFVQKYYDQNHGLLVEVEVTPEDYK